MKSLRRLVPTSPKHSFFALIVALLTLALSSGCRGDKSVFVELDRARRTTADLRIQFNKAADASNRAVMADTDEASVAFARDAEQTLQIVESETAKLAAILQSPHFPNEIRLLEEFKNHFSEYLKLDQSILGLAVENTNLKAQRLSFGPLREVAERFKNSLESIAGKFLPKDRCRIDALIAKAVLAVREIQVLHAPHIAESDAAAMTRIERELDNLQATASNAVIELSGFPESKAPDAVAVARKELGRFKEISDQIVTLSRRNSNVRSLELALRTQLPLTAACDDSLRAIQNALAKEGSKATR